MLPISASSSGGRSLSSALLPEYLWRLVAWRQIDIQFALAQAVDLCLRPAEVSKTTRIRKQIKNEWARDDPAFTLILMAVILATTLAYAVCFSAWNPLHLLRLLVGGLLFEFLACGALIATALRWYLNTHKRIQRIHTVEQTVEWLYAFDVHCNALLPSFLLVGVLQYALLPLILSPHTFLATALANTLWLAGVAFYAYVSFLGYSALPFIDRPERLLYPMGAVCVVYLLLLLTNVNVSITLLDLYFGHWHESPENALKLDDTALDVAGDGR